MQTEAIVDKTEQHYKNSPNNEQIIFHSKTEKQLALDDIYDGLKRWHVWSMLAYQDIKLRYRRSILGPFWITISMAITVYSMGYLYSHLFHSDITTYFPFLVGGMLSWALISNTIVDLIDTFGTYEGMLKQIKLPYTLYIHRVSTRNLFIFFHHLLVIVPILIIFHDSAKVNLNTLLVIPGLCLIYINAFCYGTALAIIGARYRDVSQILKSLVQVVFFMTPIMWKPDLIPASKRYILLFNPFSSFVEIIRAPLIGATPSLGNLVVVSIITLLGVGIAYKMLVNYRSKIVYWL